MKKIINLIHRKKRKQAPRTLKYALNNDKENDYHIDEIYRHIQTNIDFSNVSKELKIINLTSTQPAEGKTITAINLAIAYASVYQNVLLIDCDLRKSQLHNYFKLSKKDGLTTHVLDFAKTKKFKLPEVKTINDVTFQGTLSIMSSGTKVPNPGEFLQSESFKRYMEHLKEHYDFIILDCPPIGIISDSVPVCHLADGTVFVYSSEITDKRASKEAIKTLKRIGAHIIGIIMTDVDHYKNYKYNYYYYDYYGDEKK